MLREMNVRGLTFDPLTNTPIVVLRDSAEKIQLPIWVGVAEANAIALELENIQSPRPMTHDLVRALLNQVNAQVVRVVVNDVRSNTYYAEIVLDLNGVQITLDSRPSDAIAIALRSDAPIYVAEHVLTKCRTPEPVMHWQEQDELQNWLEEITPEDFSLEM